MSFIIVSDSASDIHSLAGVEYKSVPLKINTDAKEYVDTHNLPAALITINSWNEWTETSYLQPDNLYGYGYLEAVKKVFKDK